MIPGEVGDCDSQPAWLLYPDLLHRGIRTYTPHHHNFKQREPSASVASSCSLPCGAVHVAQYTVGCTVVKLPFQQAAPKPLHSFEGEAPSKTPALLRRVLESVLEKKHGTIIVRDHMFIGALPVHR